MRTINIEVDEDAAVEYVLAVPGRAEPMRFALPTPDFVPPNVMDDYRAWMRAELVREGELKAWQDTPEADRGAPPFPEASFDDPTRRTRLKWLELLLDPADYQVIEGWPNGRINRLFDRWEKSGDLDTGESSASTGS